MTPREEWHLDTHHLGRRVLLFDCLDSTNRFAAGLADDPGNDGVVVLADTQTAGRGQHGRSWQSPPRTGVLLSVLLFLPPALRRPVILAAWAAVAVCECIREVVGRQARIKWPNDVLLDGRKVCGILIEQARGTVVGIGLNVSQTAADFAAAGLPDAGSLAGFTASPPDCEQVARLLIRRLDEHYARLIEGDASSLQAEWQAGVGLIGKEVLVETHQGDYRGRLRQLTFDGLAVEPVDGEPLRLPPESVRHLHPV
jgi:BirA family biotin operon repressor/biotin-[acetyl-CoA-carboxylase] ligase